MPVPKGVRYGGRQKGTPNKTTVDMRAALAALASANFHKLQGWIDEVEDPARRATLFLDLCEYCVPRLARTELTGADGGPLQVGVFRFADAAEQLEAKTVPDGRL